MGLASLWMPRSMWLDLPTLLSFLDTVKRFPRHITPVSPDRHPCRANLISGPAMSKRPCPTPGLSSDRIKAVQQMTNTMRGGAEKLRR